MSESQTNNHKKHYLFLLLILVGVGGILYGFDIGVIGPALEFLKQSIVLNTVQTEWVVGGVFVGGLFGTLVAGPLADNFGRKLVVALSALVFMIGVLSILVAHGFILLMVGRILLGTGVGLVAVAVPLYAVELAPTKYRGRAVTIFQLLLTSGIVLAYFIGLLFQGSHDWRAMFAIVLIPSAILLFGTFVLPQSPRFLVSKGNESEARKVLLKTRPADEAERDLQEIHDSFKHTKGTWSELFSKRLAFALFVAGSIAILQQLTGINSFLQYAPLMLKNAGLGSLSILGSLGITILNLITTIVGMSLVDRIGRKPLLLGGLIGIIIGEVFLGSLQFFHLAVQTKGVLSLVGLLIFIVGYAIGPGVVVWLAMSELFPTRDRGKGLAVCLFLNSLGSTLVATSFLTLSHNIGISNVYFLGAFFTLLYFLVANFGLPETKGHSLEEIQHTMGTD